MHSSKGAPRSHLSAESQHLFRRYFDDPHGCWATTLIVLALIVWL
jgi:hypothetical protein